MTTVLLAAISLVAIPTSAAAAANALISVGEVTMTPADAQLTIGDVVTVAGSWDATQADPQSGDTFTIGLPPQFEFPQAIPFDLIGDGEVWGKCLTNPSTGIATCTLTDAVDEQPELVAGTWKFEVEVVQATTATHVVFDLNGSEVSVPLPGDGGIDDGIQLPGEMAKSGVMNANNWSMTWTIDLPGANMAGQQSIVLTDTLGAGHVLCDPMGLTVQTIRGSDVRDVTSIAHLDGAPGDAGFGLTLTAPNGGFDPNVTYRINYQTCTPDGKIDPAGTEYENSAQVQGWGEAGIGVSTVTNKGWHASLTKSGSVLGGSDRNGKIVWNVTIPGDQLVGKNTFTLAETLGDGHQLDNDTFSGMQVFEQYGPSADQRTRIDGQFTRTVATPSAQSFTLIFTIRSGSDFAFKPSDHRYIVTYSTKVTETALPEGGTRYANSVNVDGETTSSEAVVPDRPEGKKGMINGSTVTVDGVEHMPQTTLTWDVIIPGQMVDGLSELDLTDTLSASQMICPAGDPSGGGAARLALSVHGEDQISGGGKPRIALTEHTTVSLEGQRIGLHVAAPEGQTFSREYQYRLRYTTCTASGGMDAPGTVYGNQLEGSGIEFTSSATQTYTGSGTGTGVKRGSVAISKSLTDNTAAAFVPAGTTFQVKAQEVDPTGAAQGDPYVLQVPLDGAPVNGLTARGNGWSIRLSEPTLPRIAGVVWGEPAFQASPGVTPSDDGTSATVALTPGSNIPVTLINTALLGSVEVTKRLTGPDTALGLVDPDQTYRVTAQIDTSSLGADFPAQSDRVLDIAAGQTVTLGDLPIGAVITFSEAAPADDDALTWSTPVISPPTMTVAAAHASDPAEVTVTNHVERTLGTFSVVKSVTGEQRDNPAVPAEVTVTARWQQDGSDAEKTLTVPVDGTPVPLGEKLLIGTEVTLTETPLADGSSIAWGAPVWSGTGVVVDGASAVVSVTRDADASVLLENHAATSAAGISLLKGVAGEAAGEVAEDAEFPVTASWTDGEGATHSKQLMINASTPTPLGVELPAGTVVTLTEGTSPASDTVIWGSITISGEGVTDLGEGGAEVVVSEQQGDDTLVTVVNEATWAPGTFTLGKDVEGVLLENPDLPASVTVTATWTENDEQQSAEMELPLDGTAVAFGQDLPHGTQVLLAEVAPADADAFTWNTPVWQGEGLVANEDGTATLTLSAATDPTLTLTNSVTARLGSLSIAKVLTGSGAELMQDALFPITATWTDLLGDVHEQELTVTAGQPTVLEGLPLGAEVILVEHAADSPANARWHGATWSTEDEAVALGEPDGDAITLVVTGEEGASAEVTVTNEYEKLPDLATTGGVISTGIAVLAALLIGVGLLLSVMRRRRA